MSRRVWKYSLPIEVGVQELQVAYGCKLLHVDAQDIEPGRLQLWADVSWADEDPSPDVVVVRAVIVPTGGEPPAKFDYVGTALMAGGSLVWHVYLDREREGLFA